MTSHHKRVRRVYFAFRLVAPFVFALWLTIANLYFVSAITADPLRLALLLVVLEASTFVFEVPTGVIADSFSRKWSMVIGYIIWGGGYLLQALLPIYEVTLLSQAIWGLGFTFVSGAPEAWLVDELGQAEAEPLLLRGAQLGQIATLAGIPVATALATAHLALPIAVGGGATLILSLGLAKFMPEAGFKPAGHAGVTWAGLRETLATSVGLLRGRPVLRAIALIGLVIGASVGGFDAMYAPHIVGNFVLPLFAPEVWFGILLGAVTLLTIPVIELIRRQMVRAHPPKTTVILAAFALFTVLANLVFVWAPAFAIAALAFCMSQVLRTVTKPLFMIWVNRQAPSAARATVISLYWQSNALGQIAGAPLLGALGTLMSLRLALSAASLALTPVIPLYLRQPEAGAQVAEEMA